MPSACEMFSRRFDLLENIFSIFQGVFARIVKVTHLAQVINFREMAHGKIRQRKVDKNNSESTFLLLLLLFFSQYNSKTNSYCPFFKPTAKTKSLLSFLFSSLCFSNRLFSHAVAKGPDRVIIAKQISK